MALIRCPECDKEVSSEARACPHCGYPLRTAPSKRDYSEQQIRDYKAQLKELKNSVITFVIFGTLSLILMIVSIVIEFMYGLFVLFIIAGLAGFLFVVFLLVLVPIATTRIANRKRVIEEYKFSHPEMEG